MPALQHKELSDREKVFYETEARFVDLSAQHYRALATISATELGFLIASLTLAGTNEVAKNFVKANSAYGTPIVTLLLCSIVFGTLQGRFFSKNLLYGSRSGFIPDDARVKASRFNFNQEQIKELLNVPDKEAKKLKKKYELNAKLTSISSLVATISFVFANILAAWLLLTKLSA